MVCVRSYLHTTGKETKLCIDKCTRQSILLAVLLAASMSMAGTQTIRIEPPVRVSPLGSGGHFWGVGNTHAAPDDSRSLITCGIRIRSDPLSWEGYLYASADGGLTWRPARIDSTLSDTGVPDQVSETSCAMGRHGTMYMNTSVYGKWHSQPFQLSRSTDGGQTWSEPLQRRGWYDATRSVVDNSGGVFDGRLYIFSNRFLEGPNLAANPCYPCYEPLLVSTDGGRSVQPASTKEPGKQYASGGWPSQAVVLNDGKVMAVHVALFGAMSNGGKSGSHRDTPAQWGIEVVTSSDGGRSLDKPVTIRKWRRDLNTQTTDTAEPNGIYNSVAALAVDRSLGPYRNRVYGAWREADSADAVARIMLAWSSDSGKTWSRPIRVDDAAQYCTGESNAQSDRGTDPMVPSVAVNKDGTVGLLWMERLLMPSWRFSASVDGGATFLPSVPVYTTHSTDRQAHAELFNNYVTVQDHPNDSGLEFHPQQDKVGFVLYTQFDQASALATTTDGIFHPIWITRDDGAVWTTRVEVDRETPIRSTTSIAGLQDISKRVRLEVRGFHYDWDSERVLVDVVLVNTSLGVPERFPITRTPMPTADIFNVKAISHPLTAPLILRMTAILSGVGQLQLVNFDGIDATGTPLLDWSGALPEGGLPPGARSFARRLEFRLTGVKPVYDPDTILIVNVTAQVLSK